MSTVLAYTARALFLSQSHRLFVCKLPSSLFAGSNEASITTPPQRCSALRLGYDSKFSLSRRVLMAGNAAAFSGLQHSIPLFISPSSQARILFRVYVYKESKLLLLHSQLSHVCNPANTCTYLPTYLFTLALLDHQLTVYCLPELRRRSTDKGR